MAHEKPTERSETRTAEATADGYGARPLAPQDASLPSIAGYDTLALLGRGGMGRVFMARHQALGRVVAIKMLIDAGDEMLVARFQAESQAVARLQHPNIAQVFETGQVQGQPFLVLEYIEGGSLAQQIAGKPQAPQDAARIVETLALAMEHSHHHEIIHRDLKPGNVLLAAGGTPKITDFGLAKRLHENSSLTHTGDVLGTPSYMAPEQASGGTSKVGPGADIYALGAILYEMLTGRAPFQGPDSMQTLMMVLTMEPVAPSRLLPQMPRDLETICLKCLEKSPKKRYASAALLADDLRRFLDGRPIVARPVRWWERVFKWAKRRPAAALLVLVLFASVIALIVGFLEIRSTNTQLESSSEKLRLTNTQLEASIRETEDANRRLQASMRDTEESLLVGQYAIDRMLVRLSEQLAPLPQSDDIRRESLEDARKLYEKITAIRPSDRAGISRSADALGKLGSIYNKLGRLDDAEATYRKALAIHTDLKTQEPASADHRRGCANTLLNLANLELQRGRNEKTELLSRSGLAEIDPLLKNPDAVTIQSASELHNTVALALSAQKKFEDAEKEHEAALVLRRQWVSQDKESNEAKTALALSLSNWTKVLTRRKKLADAVDALTEAEKLLAGHTSPQQRSYLGQFQANRAVVFEVMKKNSEAEATHGLAIRTLDALVKDYSSVPAYRFLLAKAHVNLGRFFGPRGRFEEALHQFRIAGPMLDRLAKDHPDILMYRTEQELCRKFTRWIEDDLANEKKKQP